MDGHQVCGDTAENTRNTLIFFEISFPVEQTKASWSNFTVSVLRKTLDVHCSGWGSNSSVLQRATKRTCPRRRGARASFEKVKETGYKVSDLETFMSSTTVKRVKGTFRGIDKDKEGNHKGLLFRKIFVKREAKCLCC